MPDRCVNNRIGFTLIELAIVLVIIGLLVGGTLVGRDLIHAALIRKTIGQYEQFSLAVNTFKTKYTCMPGDCQNAEGFGFYPGSNGNGDTIIGASSVGTCTYEFISGASCDTELQEYTNFWYHLSAANLIPYSLPDYVNTPGVPNYHEWVPGVATPPVIIRPVSSTMVFGVATSSGWTIMADLAFDPSIGGGGLSPHVFLIGMHSTRWSSSQPLGYPPIDTMSIDQKIDDGYPFTGTTRVLGKGSVSGSGGGPAVLMYTMDNNLKSQHTPYCVDDTVSPAMYNASYPGNQDGPEGNCAITIKAPF